jgi:hypothetical protein
MEIIVSDQSRSFTGAAQDLASAYILEPRPVFNRARAINLGAGMARNGWICAVDVDVMPRRGFCRDVAAHRPKYFLTYCTFIVMEGNHRHFDPPFYWGSDIHMFSKGLWYDAGRYCEEYEGYGYEDVDFCDRCTSAGARMVELPIQVDHDPHPKVATIAEDLKRNGAIYEGRH